MRPTKFSEHPVGLGYFEEPVAALPAPVRVKHGLRPGDLGLADKQNAARCVRVLSCLDLLRSLASQLNSNQKDAELTLDLLDLVGCGLLQMMDPDVDLIDKLKGLARARYAALCWRNVNRSHGFDMKMSALSVHCTRSIDVYFRSFFIALSWDARRQAAGGKAQLRFTHRENSQINEALYRALRQMGPSRVFTVLGFFDLVNSQLFSDIQLQSGTGITIILVRL